jgi:hypothetical protein
MAAIGRSDACRAHSRSIAICRSGALNHVLNLAEPHDASLFVGLECDCPLRDDAYTRRAVQRAHQSGGFKHNDPVVIFRWPATQGAPPAPRWTSASTGCLRTRCLARMDRGLRCGADKSAPRLGFELLPPQNSWSGGHNIHTHERPLRTSTLSTRLTRIATYQGTICRVDAKDFVCIIGTIEYCRPIVRPSIHDNSRG